MKTKSINFDILEDDSTRSPCLANPEDFSRLVNGDAILDERTEIKVLIEYPVPEPRTLTIKCGPVTIETFARAVLDTYRIIFGEKKKHSRLPSQIRPEHLVLSGADRGPDGTWRLIVEI